MIAIPKYIRATDELASTASQSGCAPTALTARDGTPSAVIDPRMSLFTAHHSDPQAPLVARPASPIDASTTSHASQSP
jgi:hypothetical protein